MSDLTPSVTGPVFGRSREWRSLIDFVTSELPGSRLAVVLGRRRQGKTLLLQELAAVTNSFYWEAAEQSAAQNLASFSAAWSSYVGLPATMQFRSWTDALDVCLAPTASPRGVFIDEVGYLISSSPEFPSLLQRHLGPAAERSGTARVILCGSIYAQMTGLLGPNAPLRGRHHLVVDVQPFEPRVAAEFWGLDSNPDAAFQLHALVGGTPAYLRYARGEKPQRGNVAKWAQRHLLDPSSPLFHEGQILVAHDPTLVDKSLYWSVLGAVADGHARRSDIADAVGRPATALGQPLSVLSSGRWIDMVPDAFHPRASTVQLTESIVRAYRVLIAPNQRRLSIGHAAEVWEDSQHRIARLIHAPHLEQLANDWVLRHASHATVGAAVRQSGPGILRRHRVNAQIDVVAVEPDRNDVDRIRAIGEVKAERSAMGVAELERLDTLVGSLGERAGHPVRRLLFARAGFTSELARIARQRGDVELIDLDRLYGGE